MDRNGAKGRTDILALLTALLVYTMHCMHELGPGNQDACRSIQSEQFCCTTKFFNETSGVVFSTCHGHVTYFIITIPSYV
jgi:hypothetical protein